MVVSGVYLLHKWVTVFSFSFTLSYYIVLHYCHSICPHTAWSRVSTTFVFLIFTPSFFFLSRCLSFYLSLSLWWNTFSLLHPSLSLCHALSSPPISRALIPSRPLLSTLPPPRNTFCCKPALSLLIFTTNIHTHANAHAHIYAQQWAVSPLKSHKEHNKAPLSTNLLAMGNPRGCTSMLETKTLTYLDTCTHMLFIHAKINLPACVSV